MQNSNRLIGVGLVGFGFSGSTFHAPLISATSGLELIALVSKNPKNVRTKLTSVPIFSDIDAILANPAIDVVVIATPNVTHAPIARMALAAGKHIVIEKPFALDLEEARSLTQAAKLADRLLCVFHNRRWDSDFLTVRAAIESGQIGDVVYLESRFDRFRPKVRSRWRDKDLPGSGLWWDLGSHLVDQALQLFGLPDRVLASLAVQRDGAMVNDWAHVILFFGKRRVVLHTGLLAAGGTHRFTAHGTKGSLFKHDVDQQELQLNAGMFPGAPGWGDDPDPVVIHHGDGTLQKFPAIPGDQRCFYTKLADALSYDATPPVTTLEALAVMAVLEAATKSSNEGRAVAPALTEAERRQWSRRK